MQRHTCYQLWHHSRHVITGYCSESNPSHAWIPGSSPHLLFSLFIWKLSTLLIQAKSRLFNLPSLFAAWCFWTFHNKSHNMKNWSSWVIHDHHFSHVLVYMNKMNFYGSMCAFLEYFLKKKLPSDRHSHLGWESLTEWFFWTFHKS